MDDELAARLGQAQGNARRLLIELAGQRRIDAVPALLKAANDPDPLTRAAALTALGAVVGLDNLSVLIDRVIAPGNAEEKEVAQSALRTACTRMPDREACADRLTAALARAPVPAQCAVLEILGTMGGTRSLQTVAAAAKDASPELQDTASRLLGEWMTVDAAPVLVELATSAPMVAIRRGRSGVISGWCGSSRCPTISVPRCAGQHFKSPNAMRRRNSCSRFSNATPAFRC